MIETPTALLDAPPETDVELAPPLERTREERIRERAHALWVERNGAPGDADDDWFRAAREIDSAVGEGSE